jgi:bifunctional non-homologous end joining protein LigD
VTVVESLPHFVEPMLLTATREVPSSPGWALEVKWDGMRAQARFDGLRVTVRSRSGRECTDQFPELQAIAGALSDQALFDGELVCFDDEGLPDFERLRSRIRARTPAAVAGAVAEAPATLVIFDVLHLAGEATRFDAYRERRARLDALALEETGWRTPRAFSVEEDLATITRDHHLEGVVAKRLDAPYQPGRRRGAWLKHKHRHRERLTVTGWRPGDRHEPDELLVARREPDGTLLYAGGVRFGLDGYQRDQLRDALRRLQEPSPRRSRVRRVRPLLDVDVESHGTPGGPLRDPVLRNVALGQDPAA